MIVIIAIVVVGLFIAGWFIRQGMDKARLEHEAVGRSIKDAERQERMRERFDDTTVALPVIPEKEK